MVAISMLCIIRIMRVCLLLYCHNDGAALQSVWANSAHVVATQKVHPIMQQASGKGEAKVLTLCMHGLNDGAFSVSMGNVRFFLLIPGCCKSLPAADSG